MPDYVFHLDQLSPTEALQLLAQTVIQLGSELEADYLASIGMQTSRGLFETQITLLLPEALSQKRYQQTFTTFLDTYKRFKSAAPRRRQRQGEVMLLAKGIAWLLINSVQTQLDLPPPAIATQNEYLLVVPNLDHQRAAVIFEDLRFHATQIRLATTTTPDGQPVYLFHILDDQHRLSSFQSVLSSAALSDDCRLLSHFASEDKSVFLPAGISPDPAALAFFCQLLSRVPPLWGGRVQDTEFSSVSSLLAAIDQLPTISDEISAEATTEEKQLTFQYLYLLDLTFHSQIEFTPSAAHYAIFNLCTLADSPTMVTQLQAAINTAEPKVGYRLELRRTKRHDVIEAEQLRLREQQLELEYRLAYLNSVAQPRPRLLRFTQRQLPALADVIRSFPESVIRDGLLQYGFQATAQNPSGLHFIFVDAEHTSSVELTPLLQWQDLDERPIRFWLDPYWASDYQGRGNDCLIFVPEGTALFPALHGWDSNGMDAYLRAMMMHWFPEQVAAAHSQDQIPERPIYLFDGLPCPEGEIQISVLDQAAMQPLQTRLGWLSDHLLILHTIEVESFITQMADAAKRQQLLQQTQLQATVAETAFEKVALEASTRIAAKTVSLTQIVTTGLDRVIKQTRTSTDELQQLDDQLQDLRALQRDMKALLDEVDQLQTQTKSQAQAVDGDLQKLKERVASVLGASKVTRIQVETQLQTEIKQLRATRDELQRRLSRI